MGAEALARWRRPTGVVPPSEFVPLLENTPLSGRLTYWVIETVAAELTDWLRAHPDVHVSINVPPELLGRGGMEHVGRRAGLGDFAGQIVLEITERGIPDALGLQALTGAPARGIRLALDDVTLSGANLVILSRCPFHIIKIDQSNVKQIVPGKPHPQWIEGLAALLHNSSLDVIAEGVESAGQAEVLRGAGIHLAQGYYFSRTPPAAELIRFHADRVARPTAVRAPT